MSASRDPRIVAVEAVATALAPLDADGRGWVLQSARTAQWAGAVLGNATPPEVVRFAENLLRAERGEL